MIRSLRFSNRFVYHPVYPPISGVIVVREPVSYDTDRGETFVFIRRYRLGKSATGLEPTRRTGRQRPSQMDVENVVTYVRRRRPLLLLSSQLVSAVRFSRKRTRVRADRLCRGGKNPYRKPRLSCVCVYTPRHDFPCELPTRCFSFISGARALVGRQSILAPTRVPIRVYIYTPIPETRVPAVSKKKQ